MRLGPESESALIHQFIDSARHPLRGRRLPRTFEYCRSDQGCEIALPTRPKSNDCEYHIRPRGLAAWAGACASFAKTCRISLMSPLRFLSGNRAVIQFFAIEISEPSNSGVGVGACSLGSSSWKPKRAQTCLGATDAELMASAGSIMKTPSAYTAKSPISRKAPHGASFRGPFSTQSDACVNSRPSNHRKDGRWGCFEFLLIRLNWDVLISVGEISRRASQNTPGFDQS